MSRARRWTLIVAGFAVLSLAVLLGLAHSTTFAAWILPRVLPAGTQIVAVQGSFAGGMRIEGFTMPGIAIDQLSLAAALTPTLLGTPTLAQLEASGIRIDLAAFPSSDAEPAAGGPVWPESLPQFALGPVSLRDIEIAGETPLRIDTASWTGLRSHGSALLLERLRIEGPGILFSADGTVGLSAASDLRGEFRYADFAGGLTLSGNPAQALEVAVRMSAPMAGELSGTLRGLLSAPDGELRVQLPTVPVDAPGLEGLRPLAPFAMDLTLKGDLKRVRVGGVLTVQGQPLQLDGTEISATPTQVTLAPLSIGLGAGSLRVEGQWPLAAAQGAGELTLRGEQLAWPGVPATLATLDAELRGTAADLGFTLDATVQPEDGELPVRIEGRWADGLLDLTSMSLADGEVRGQLRYRVADAALESSLELLGLDLARVLPGHPSRIDGALSLAGTPGDWRLGLSGVQGEWRDLPLSVAGDIAWDGRGLPAGTLDAALDGNQLRLRPIEGGHQATLQLGKVGALRKGAEAEGRVELTQRGETLDFQVAVTRAKIPGAETLLRLDALTGYGRVQFGAEPGVEAELELARLVMSEVIYGPVKLSVGGDRTRHRLSIEATGPQGRVSVAASGGLQSDNWSGVIERLMLAPAGLPEPPLVLAAAMPLSHQQGRLTLQRACLQREAASVCVEGALSTMGTAAGTLSVSLVGLDLALLPQPADGDWRAQGALDGSAQLTFAGPALQSLTADLASPDLRLTLVREDTDKALALRDLRLTAAGPLTALGARLAATLEDAGPFEASVEGLGSERLSGQVTVDFASLRVLDGLSPEFVAPEGRLAGQLTLAGPPDALEIGGALNVSDLRAELPGAGLKLVAGELALSFPEPGKVALRGELGTGEGRLQIEALAERDPEGRAQLTAQLRGERVLVADLPNVRLLASPAVQLQTRNGVLFATGTLALPEGRIDLERFEPGVSASPDVVVLDRPETSPAPVQTDIRYTLGPDLSLKGFGLNARLAGGLRVRSRPGRPVTASGTLDLSGGYRAYGQNLTIDRGRLLWANAPIGNPGFDFSAYRSIDRLKAGVRVRGSASAPELTVYTDPPREASDALSWLVLGRPLSSASGDDGQQLSAAAGALGSVGGALIGATIGQRLGVEINVESSAELGGSPAFTVGKMLSPKLFVGFGRSLFDSAQLVIVRYRLTEHFELEALSGRETKIGANYRLER